jgi:hypothetical protein
VTGYYMHMEFLIIRSSKRDIRCLSKLNYSLIRIIYREGTKFSRIADTYLVVLLNEQESLSSVPNMWGLKQQVRRRTTSR